MRLKYDHISVVEQRAAVANGGWPRGGDQRQRARGDDQPRAGDASGVRFVIAAQKAPGDRQRQGAGALDKIGGGRVAALEIVFATPAISNLIRRGKTNQITSLIQSGVKQGMIEMDGSIRALYEEGIVTARAAYDKAVDKELFKDIMDEGGSATD